MLNEPVSLPKHFESEEDHNDDGRVEGVDRRDEGGDAESEQGRNDRHHNQGRDGRQEDDQLVVTHRENG